MASQQLALPVLRKMLEDAYAGSDPRWREAELNQKRYRVDDTYSSVLAASGALFMTCLLLAVLSWMFIYSNVATDRDLIFVLISIATVVVTANFVRNCYHDWQKSINELYLHYLSD